MAAVFFIIVFFIGAFSCSIVNVRAYRMPPGISKMKLPAGFALHALLGGSLAVMSVYWFGQSEAYGVRGLLRAALVFVLLEILAIISFIDIAVQKIPKELVEAVFICAAAAAILFDEPDILSRAGGAFAVSLPMLVLTCCSPGAFGGGDIKLMAAAGVFLGCHGIMTAFISSLLTAGGYCFYLLLSGKKDRKGQFAFGPFLCIGITAAVFLG